VTTAPDEVSSGASAFAGSATPAPVAPAPQAAPAARRPATSSAPAFSEKQRYGESVVREILGATFLEEQSHEPAVRPRND